MMLTFPKDICCEGIPKHTLIRVGGYINMREHNFVVGDIVKAKRDGCGYEKGQIGEVHSVRGSYPSSFIDIFDKNKSCLMPGCLATNFELYKPHEGKILIMVDEKDPNKIIARDLITNKTAEAKRNPKDDWDFAKGAKLALERLTEPEKPKGWTGKVVCVQSDPPASTLFEKGKIYRVENGRIFHEGNSPWIRLNSDALFMSAEEVITYFKEITFGYIRFIEYKGGAEE